MTMLKNRTPRLGALVALLSSAVLFAAAPSPAAAAPDLHVDSVSQTSVPVTAHAEVETLTQGSSSPAQNEVQRLTVAAGAGTYRVSFGGETTGDIKVIPSSFFQFAPVFSRVELQQKLEALPAIGAGNVLVNGGGPPGPYGRRPFRIEFIGALAGTDVDQLSVEDGSEPLLPGIMYLIQVTNIGSDPTDGTPLQLSVSLPPGFSGAFADPGTYEPFECPSVAGESTIVCSRPTALPVGSATWIALYAAIDPSTTPGLKTATFSLSGGGAAAVTTADPVSISPSLPGFGVEAFDAPVLGADGAEFTQAGGHPDSAAGNIDFNVSEPEAGIPSYTTAFPAPAEHPKDAIVDLPPGLLGNPAVAPRCSLSDLASGESIFVTTQCSSESQVGELDLGLFTLAARPGIPVYNMTPAPGSPARFGFNFLGTMVLLNAVVRNGSDYGVTIGSLNIPEALSIYRTKLKFWGDPASPTHDPLRNCPGHGGAYGNGCPSAAAEAPFLRFPTSCEGPLTTHLSADSWFHPGQFVERTFSSHGGISYPWPEDEWGPTQGPEGCEKVRFNPSVEASPTTKTADAPTGLDFHLAVPQDCWDHVEEICQSDLRDAEVLLPQGMTLNPSAASGLGSCSEEQVGYKPGTAGPFEFSEDPVRCPDNSKIGTVEIDSPLLAKFDAAGQPLHNPAGGTVPDPLEGAVYLAKQMDNPAGSLLGFYLVAEGSGTVLKQFGEIRTGADGRLTTVFRDAPQQPFSDLSVQLFGGPRGPLRTPSSCGTFGISAELTPWSGTGTVSRSDAFEIENCPRSGFQPKLDAGTTNPLAGSTSPFVLRVTRDDGEQELAGLTAQLPPGLSGYLKGIAYCSDAALAGISGEVGTGAPQEASPACPAASRVGSVTVAAGAGANPFFTRSAGAYLAGPYKGAPLSLAVVAPAVAGPFDLGSVVVRNALRIDPNTAQITSVSDPIPTILHGIPLDLRDVRVELNRPDFILNPTSCDPMQIGSTLTSSRGSTASPSVHFQVAGCDRLGFKPQLSLRLKGPAHRAAHPALRAVLRARPGDANIGEATVILPKTELLENAHIGEVCTRVQYAAGAGGGAGCPEGSIYGYAKAWTPLLDQPLEGPVYLRSNGGERELPDLVASLGGQIHIDLVGYIDSVHARIRNRFAVVPDAPVSKFVLNMQGGSKGLLANNVDLCRAQPRATAQFVGQNGKVRNLRPKAKADCGRKRSRGRGHRRRG